MTTFNHLNKLIWWFYAAASPAALQNAAFLIYAIMRSKNCFSIFVKESFWYYDLTTCNHLIEFLAALICVRCQQQAFRGRKLVSGRIFSAQNYQMRSTRWSKVVKSSYQNGSFTKTEKDFFRHHDCIHPAYPIPKGCCGRLQLHKTTK